MKKIMLLLLIAMMVMTLPSCKNVVSDADLSDFSDMVSNNPVRIEFAIYKTGSSSDTYHYILHDNNELITEKGKRIRNSDTPPFFNDLATKPFLERRDAFASIIIPSEDVNKIVKLTEKIIENDLGGIRGANDAMMLQILYNDKNIELEIGSIDSGEGWQLCDLLTFHSPLKYSGHTCIMATLDPTHSH